MITSSFGRCGRAVARLSVGVACGLALLVAAMALPSTQRTSLAAEFSPGDLVEVVDGQLNLRAAPGLDAAILRVLDEGMAFTVTDGPVAADGYTWYEAAFREGSTGEGWVAGEFLAPYARFGVGDQARVADGPLNYRDAPGLDAAIVAALPTGWLTGVVDGPVAADGYTWYKVNAEGASVGWVAGEFLAPA